VTLMALEELARRGWPGGERAEAAGERGAGRQR
jgi:hypothetical protein